ncbi:MAG: hypothetical protein MHM6MM_003436 [Cercozoa sp. M6MM]
MTLFGSAKSFFGPDSLRFWSMFCLVAACYNTTKWPWLLLDAANYTVSPLFNTGVRVGSAVFEPNCLIAHVFCAILCECVFAYALWPGKRRWRTHSPTQLAVTLAVVLHVAVTWTIRAENPGYYVNVSMLIGAVACVLTYAYLSWTQSKCKDKCECASPSEQGQKNSTASNPWQLTALLGSVFFVNSGPLGDYAVIVATSLQKLF